MAKQKRSQQTWWPVYALALLMAGLLILAHRLAPSPGWRTFLDVGVLVIGYSSISLWLEKHPEVLLDRPSTETDSPEVMAPELEMPSPLLSHVQLHFYVYSDPVIIYGEPEHPTDKLRLNGQTILSLQEEAAE